jgi:hypothetical protein
MTFRDHIQTHHTWENSSGRVIDQWQTPLPDNTQHSEQNIHASGAIRTCNPAKLAAADPRHRRCGHRNRLFDTCEFIFNSYSVIMKRNFSPNCTLLHLLSDLCVHTRGCTLSESISCILQMLLHEFIYLCVMNQVIICRPFTAENRVWCQAKICMICDGKLAVGQALLRVTQFSTVSIISPKLHTHISFIKHTRYIIIVTDNVIK